MHKGPWTLALCALCLVLSPFGGSASDALRNGSIQDGSTSSATIEAGEDLITMRVDGQIAIDEQGKVLDYRVDTKLQPELQVLIDKAVPSWLFWPVLVDGKPTAARTGMRITLTGTQVDTGYRIAVDNVTFSNKDASDKNSHWKIPASPGVEMTVKSRKSKIQFPGYRVDGLVVVHVRVSPQGTIEEITASQSSLFNLTGNPKILAKARKSMEDSAIKGIRGWTFNVETHGRTPKPEELSGAISVQFVWNTDSADQLHETGVWRREHRGPYHAPGWLRDTRLAQRVGSSDMGGSDVTPLASPVRLREGVLGKTL
jgi:hypothetical protein